MQASGAMIGEREFRRVMGRFATGVTVVTARGRDGEPVGLTVNAFASVSLDPLLVLVCVHRRASGYGPLLEAGCFAVNILARDQESLAVRFSAGNAQARFQGLEVTDGPLGSPLLPRTLGWLECRIREVFPGGDHSILLAGVVACSGRDGDPLLFYQGRFGGMGG